MHRFFRRCIEQNMWKPKSWADSKALFSGFFRFSGFFLAVLTSFGTGAFLVGRITGTFIVDAGVWAVFPITLGTFAFLPG